jgi:hypothetical protein
MTFEMLAQLPLQVSQPAVTIHVCAQVLAAHALEASVFFGSVSGRGAFADTV